MNQRPDDPNKHGEVITIDAPQLPAVIKKTKNTWKKFSVLDRLAEEIRERSNELDRVRREILKRQPGQKIDSDWECALVDDRDRQALARCRELIKELDGPENYDPPDDDEDDDEPILKKSVISARLAAMMAGVHIGGPKEDEQAVFAKILLNHVFDAQTSRIVLEATCREIERTKKYMQATSEVLEVLREKSTEWWKRRSAIDSIERISEYAQQELLEAHQNYEREVLEAQQKSGLHEAKAAHASAARRFHDRHAAWMSAEKFATERQERVRTNHMAMVISMNMVAERLVELEQARAELTIAYERVEQLEPPKAKDDA